MSSDFTNAGEVLKSLFDRIMPEDNKGYTGLFSGWENIVGSETAHHVVPVDVKNGSLILEADHPGWIQKIRMKQASILQAVSSRYPQLNVTKIRISLGDGKKRPAKNIQKIPENAVVEKTPTEDKKTPSVASVEKQPEEDRKFRELLEKMRRHGDS